MEIYELIRLLRTERGLSQDELAKLVGYKDRSSVAKVEAGKVDLSQTKVAMFAKALGVTPAYLLGLSPDAEPPKHPDIHPMPQLVERPRLGAIACGKPILAEENVEGYDMVPDWVHCDFTLLCKGDSMIGARIHDGDIVCIKQQPTVENGQIAAVLIDDEATLKRVRFITDGIALWLENPDYEPMIYTGEAANRVQILGLATHFISKVK